MYVLEEGVTLVSVLEINHAKYHIASGNESNPSLVEVLGWLHPQ